MLISETVWSHGTVDVLHNRGTVPNDEQGLWNFLPGVAFPAKWRKDHLWCCPLEGICLGKTGGFDFWSPYWTITSTRADAVGPGSVSTVKYNMLVGSRVGTGLRAGIQATLSRHGTQPPHASIKALHSIPATELYATTGGDEGKLANRYTTQFV